MQPIRDSLRKLLSERPKEVKAFISDLGNALEEKPEVELAVLTSQLFLAMLDLHISKKLNLGILL
jgi:hypothetical protein